jgi:hypothetical protein
MKRLTIVFGLVFSMFAVSAMAGTWTGYISESKCGAKHADGSAKSIACVTACVKNGASPVLVSEGKVIKIENTDKVMDHLGHKVTVTGNLSGDTLTIASVQAAD